MNVLMIGTSTHTTVGLFFVCSPLFTSTLYCQSVNCWSADLLLSTPSTVDRLSIVQRKMFDIARAICNRQITHLANDIENWGFSIVWGYIQVSKQTYHFQRTWVPVPVNRAPKIDSQFAPATRTFGAWRLIRTLTLVFDVSIKRSLIEVRKMRHSISKQYTNKKRHNDHKNQKQQKTTRPIHEKCVIFILSFCHCPFCSNMYSSTCHWWLLIKADSDRTESNKYERGNSCD
jgi:hypothetical protein